MRTKITVLLILLIGAMHIARAQDEFTPWIELQVRGGDKIVLRLRGATDSTRLRVYEGDRLTLEHTLERNYMHLTVPTHGAALRLEGDIRGLKCSDSCIQGIRVNGCPELETLSCAHCDIRQLDLFKNHRLRQLNCQGNPLERLQLDGAQSLKQLNCQNCGLEVLEVRACDSLLRLNCSNNRLTNLELSRNRLLESLECQNNQLTNLDIHYNFDLRLIRIHGNPLSTMALEEIIRSLRPISRNWEADLYLSPQAEDQLPHSLKLSINLAQRKGWTFHYVGGE